MISDQGAAKPAKAAALLKTSCLGYICIQNKFSVRSQAVAVELIGDYSSVFLPNHVT